MDYNKCLEEFMKYVNNFDLNNEKINIKYYHTLNVVRLMEKLAKYLKLTDSEVELTKIIGLLHDIGRFIQIKENGDYDDLKTKSNHAELGVNYLFRENHIRDFIKEDKYDDIICFVILNHNSLKLKKSNDDKALLFLKMLRDMDKVDIYRVEASYYEHELKSEEVSLDVLNDFNKEAIIDRKKLKTKSDEALSYLSFIYDINFKESFEILNDTDNLELFASSLNISRYDEEFAKKIFDKVRKIVEKNIE
jgi:putative nucleotidyltransferase with HDIG domain